MVQTPRLKLLGGLDAGMTNLDSELEFWFACAGQLVEIPPPEKSDGYYFLQNTGCIKSAISSPPGIICRVEDVTYLADTKTDQVLTKIKLSTVTSSGPIHPKEALNASPAAPVIRKILVSVVRGCSGVTDKCVSALDPSVSHRFSCSCIHENIDTSGVLKTFTIRHPYLSDGWAEFLMAKGLMEGGTKGFLRVVIQPEKRKSGCGHGLDTLAIAGLSFEVSCYPQEFVVKAAVLVEAAVHIPLEVGMKLEFVENEYISQVVADPGPWPTSSRRHLQATHTTQTRKVAATLASTGLSFEVSCYHPQFVVKVADPEPWPTSSWRRRLQVTRTTRKVVLLLIVLAMCQIPKVAADADCAEQTLLQAFNNLPLRYGIAGLFGVAVLAGVAIQFCRLLGGGVDIVVEVGKRRFVPQLP